MLAVMLLAGRPQEALVGKATYYAEGRMEQVAANRHMDLAGFRGGVALNDCAYLGRIVWLRWWSDNGVARIVGPFLTIDCAQAPHSALRERLRYVVEVDAEQARRMGMYGVGPRRVEVLFSEPEELWRWTPM